MRECEKGKGRGKKERENWTIYMEREKSFKKNKIKEEISKYYENE